MNNLKKTTLEHLIFNCNEYKNEIFEFLGLTHIYENSHNTTNALIDTKWLETKINDINTNLVKDKIQISVSKSTNFFCKNIVHSQYLPSFNLTHPEFNIDVICTTFFNKIMIYNKDDDFIQIEPKIELLKPLSEEQYKTLFFIFDTVTSELTQHTYFDNNLKNKRNTKDIKNAE